MMFSHATVGISDVPRALRFYDAVMAVLGQPLLMPLQTGAAYGTWEGSQLFVRPPFDGGPAVPGNGMHLAFTARDRATVDAFHAAALASGGSDEGAPGLRPQYHPDYYGAYVRDPDGNKLQAVCHRKPQA